MYSSIFVVAAFMAGAVCGGALVMLQRYAQMEMVKAEFEQELAKLCEVNGRTQQQVQTLSVSRDGVISPVAEDDCTADAASPEQEWITIAPAVIHSAANHIMP